MRVDLPTPLGPEKAVIFFLINTSSSERVVLSVATTGKTSSSRAENTI